MGQEMERQIYATGYNNEDLSQCNEDQHCSQRLQVMFTFALEMTFLLVKVLKMDYSYCFQNRMSIKQSYQAAKKLVWVESKDCCTLVVFDFSTCMKFCDSDQC